MAENDEAITYERAFPEVQLLPDAGPRILSYYAVTTMIPITDSGSQTQRIFFSSIINVGPFDSTKYSLYLSSLPETNADIIVDDGVYVNGHAYGGFSSTTADPKANLGRNPSVCYRGVPAIDISRDVRSDGQVFIQLADLGGYTYCSSALYIRAVKK